MAIGNALKQGFFVVAAKRTPFGTFGGALKNHTPTDLQVGNKFTACSPVRCVTMDIGI